MKCPTIRIIADNSDKFMDINLSDFDAEKHKEFKPEAKKKPTRKAPARKKAQ